MAATSPGFFGWLRSNSEHYLLVAAHRDLARRTGAPAPRPPRGAKEIFWLKVFAPTYAALPWALRSRIMRAMPGSHRRTWAPPPRAQGPAV
ncbi:hypothetical protein LWC33_14695 [Pseudonocardia sp. RS11V-5]|uniref:hypothetical protein n=1 Tax=Pseudonocardia terrae TaxID=2905831 RepID=UPI001E3060B5|nr:hypothetical protein [Pseudonocardia terrae]MCE3552702.1 hypothetical protein [Pseudonocardia terrae]